MRYGLSLLLALSLLPSLAWADAVVLQSGEKVEGTITRESDTEVAIQVEISAGIVDEKVYLRSEIAEVQKRSPEQVAWEEINGLQPGPNSLSEAGYDDTISRLSAFLNEFPNGEFASIVKERLDALRAERKRVEAGEMKFRGEWLGAAGVEKRKYEITGSILFEQMKALAAAGDAVGALNAFALMEKDYPGARDFPEAVALALQLIPGVAADARRRLGMLEHDQAEWQKGIALAAPPKRTELLAARATEQQRFNAALADAEKRGLKWGILIPRSEPSLKRIADTAPRELERLSRLDLAKMRDSLTQLDAALAAMEKGDLATAETQLRLSSTLWPASNAARSAQARLAELKQPRPTPPPVSGTLPAATPAVGPSATPTPKPESTATPTPTPAATPTPSPTPAPSPGVAEPAKPAKSFFLTIPGALTLLGATLVIAIIVELIEKFRAPPPDREDTEETPQA